MAGLPTEMLERMAALGAVLSAGTQQLSGKAPNGSASTPITPKPSPTSGVTVIDAIAVLTEHTRRLHAKVLELEARSMKYCGVWAEGVYELGDVVTHSGRMWFSESANNVDRPGNGKTAWKMMHK